jgi:hypothetical protein
MQTLHDQLKDHEEYNLLLSAIEDSEIGIALIADLIQDHFSEYEVQLVHIACDEHTKEYEIEDRDENNMAPDALSIPLLQSDGAYGSGFVFKAEYVGNPIYASYAMERIMELEDRLSNLSYVLGRYIRYSPEQLERNSEAQGHPFEDDHHSLDVCLEKLDERGLVTTWEVYFYSDDSTY